MIRHALSKRQAGFTLFELMVVMILIGMISTLVIPRFFGSYDKLPLRTGARDLAALLRFARSQAITKGRALDVLFNPETRDITLAFQPDALEAEDTNNQRQPAGNATYRLSEGLTLEVENQPDPNKSGMLALSTFFAIGNSSGSTVLLKDSAGRVKRVEVDLLTGMVAIKESSGESG